LIRVFPRIKQPGAGQPGLARAQSITAHARSFNWADCASAYLDCYQGALNLKGTSR
jgi:hypothetical protein